MRHKPSTSYEQAKHLWENEESLNKYLAKLKELMEKDEPIPRRIDIGQNISAERAIRTAIWEVENLAGDIRLTNAVILLSKALDSVSDYVDNVPNPAPIIGNNPIEVPKIDINNIAAKWHEAYNDPKNDEYDVFDTIVLALTEYKNAAIIAVKEDFNKPDEANAANNDPIHRTTGDEDFKFDYDQIKEETKYMGTEPSDQMRSDTVDKIIKLVTDYKKGAYDYDSFAERLSKCLTPNP